MGRYAIEIEYDGSMFNGWQAQPYGRTIQVEIEKAIFILTGENIRITASGRTDAGVHALCQVAHFDIIKDDFNLQRMVKGLNGILQKDVFVKNAYIVNRDFNARFSACSREYEYIIYNDHTSSPFIKNRALWINRPLDVEYLNRAVSFLNGEHDFASFCKKISLENGTVRTIETVTFSRLNKHIYFNIKGNAFLHNMIRIIIGTVIEMYYDDKPAEYMKYILEKKDRDYAGKTADPSGLYLKKVTYDPPLSNYISAF